MICQRQIRMLKKSCELYYGKELTNKGKRIRLRETALKKKKREREKTKPRNLRSLTFFCFLI